MQLNHAVVKNIQAISPVWLVPVVAVVIALWLAVQAQLQKGSIVEIYFDSAHDIKAGQTAIKLNDVKVGVVKDLSLSDDLKSVKVIAEIDRNVAEYLGDNTRFWIATPTISATEVSNLGTLISGVYIVMDPGEKQGFRSRFIGLDTPPAFESDEPGTQYILQAEELGSIDVGSPVYYRQLQVGEVTAYQLSEDKQQLDIHVFIRSPYDELVFANSRFWNVSGFGVTVNADGVKARMESLASLISGGIAFDNTVGFKDGAEAKAGHRFYLYSDRESVLAGRYTVKQYYLMKFSDSVRGLTVGAPVEFRGIKIGQVVDVVLDSVENREGSLHVFIEIEPQRLEPDKSPSREAFDERLAAMIDNGLRAQMKTASLITGSQYIELSFVDNATAAALVPRDNYSEIPVLDAGASGIEAQLTALLEKINRMPFESIGQDLALSMKSLKTILATLEEHNTAGKLDTAVADLGATLQTANAALEQVGSAMESVDLAVAPDSELKYELTAMLKSVAEAANALELFVNELNRHPNALIYGAKKDE